MPAPHLTSTPHLDHSALERTATPWSKGFGALTESLTRLSQDALTITRAEQEEGAREVIPPAEVAERLRLVLPQEGRPLHEVLDHTRELLMSTPITTGGRFFNQLFAGRDPVGAPGDMLASLVNHSMYTYKVAGPLVLIEEALIEAMRQRVGFPSSSGGGLFTPGGSLSNLVAMLCARDRVAPNAKEEGVPQGLRVYCSAEAHYSVRKGAGVVGVGRANVVAVEANEWGHMRPEALEAHMKADREAGLTPMMIIGTAGTTVLGAFDDFNALADVAEREGVWLHIDGAFGGTALWSERLRARCAGAERADSFTWDAHKAMGMPLTSSVLLTREPHLSSRALSEQASYLFQGDDALLNPGTRSLQCGRRDDALKLWAAWQYHGDQGWAERTDRLYDLALALATLVEAHPQMRLIMNPEFLTVSFVYEGRCSEAICERLRQSQRALVGYAHVRGERVIRAAVLNPELTRADLERLLSDINEVAPECPAPL